MQEDLEGSKHGNEQGNAFFAAERFEFLGKILRKNQRLLPPRWL
jgi:hypothetical protein